MVKVRTGCVACACISATMAEESIPPDRNAPSGTSDRHWRSMKLFECQNCGQPLYFENTRCESCGLRLGYLPVEEYAFFVLQSANVMLVVRALFLYLPDWQTGQETGIGKGTLLCLAASLIPWILIAVVAFVWLRRRPRHHHPATAESSPEA